MNDPKTPPTYAERTERLRVVLRPVPALLYLIATVIQSASIGG